MFRLQFIALSILFFIVSGSASAQGSPDTVNFSGTIKRHALADSSVAVSGTVHISYAPGPGYEVLVPFTIPEGQTTTQYSETIDWSLADVDDGVGYYQYGHFLIHVSCIENCTNAGLIENQLLAYTESHETSLYIYGSAKEFGADERESSYTVNLALLPANGYLEGRIALPDNQQATSDIDIDIVALDFGTYSYSVWVSVIKNQVTIPVGETGVDFRFDNLGQEPEFFIDNASLRKDLDSFTVFGYFCESQGCISHALADQGWLEAGTNKVTTSNRAVAKGVRDEFMMSEDSFAVTIPGTIELLQKRTERASVILKRAELEHDENAVIKGKIIVEKNKVRTQCDSYNNTILNGSYVSEYQGSNLWNCYYPRYVYEYEFVSEVDFELTENQQEFAVEIELDSMYQLSSDTIYADIFGDSPNLLDQQRIRFECEVGCKNIIYSKTGYYKSDEAKYAALSPSTAGFFTSTSEFANNTFYMSLLRPPMLIPIIQLLLDDDDAVLLN